MLLHNHGLEKQPFLILDALCLLPRVLRLSFTEQSIVANVFRPVSIRNLRSSLLRATIWLDPSLLRLSYEAEYRSNPCGSMGHTGDQMQLSFFDVLEVVTVVSPCCTGNAAPSNLSSYIQHPSPAPCYYLIRCVLCCLQLKGNHPRRKAVTSFAILVEEYSSSFSSISGIVCAVPWHNSDHCSLRCTQLFHSRCNRRKLTVRRCSFSLPQRLVKF